MQAHSTTRASEKSEFQQIFCRPVKITYMLTYIPEIPSSPFHPRPIVRPPIQKPCARVKKGELRARAPVASFSAFLIHPRTLKIKLILPGRGCMKKGWRCVREGERKVEIGIEGSFCLSLTRSRARVTPRASVEWYKAITAQITKS